MSKARVIPDGLSVFQARANHGLTQEELSRKAGYSKRTIERIENGKRTTRQTLEDIADVLEVNVSELMDSKTPPGTKDTTEPPRFTVFGDSRIRYFYYISEQKVEMLASQYGDHSDGNLVSTTSSLVDHLRQNDCVTPLCELDDVRTAQFVEDRSVWRHGLCSFFNKPEFEIVSYFLWKVVGSTLIVMVGSPNNILGQKVVHGCAPIVYQPSSAAAIDELHEFVQKEFGTDEPAAVVKTRYKNSMEFYNLKDSFVDRGGITYSSVVSGDVNSLYQKFKFLEDFDRSVRLAKFCARNLQHLPRTPIETVFKVFSVFKNEWPLEPIVQSPENKERASILSIVRQLFQPKDDHGLTDFNNPIKYAVLASPLFVAID